MICCNSAFEQGNLDLWRYINAFIIIIYYYKVPLAGRADASLVGVRQAALTLEVVEDEVDGLHLRDEVLGRDERQTHELHECRRVRRTVPSVVVHPTHDRREHLQLARDLRGKGRGFGEWGEHRQPSWGDLEVVV